MENNNNNSTRLSYLLVSPQNIIKSLISSFPDDISLSDLHDCSSSSSSSSESDHHNGDDRGGIRSDRLVHGGVLSLLRSVDGPSDDDEAFSLAQRKHHHHHHSDGDSTPTLSLPNSLEGDDALDFKDIRRKYFSNAIKQQRQQHQSKCAK